MYHLAPHGKATRFAAHHFAGQPRGFSREWWFCAASRGERMNLHEYQAKDIFRNYGIAVPAGRVAASAEEAVQVAEALRGPVWVVKAQGHAAGRATAGGVEGARALGTVRA